MPSRHTVQKVRQSRQRPVAQARGCLPVAALDPRGVAIIREPGGCCRVTGDLGALTLLPQASDTNVAATLEMMRARCSCWRSFMLAMVLDVSGGAVSNHQSGSDARTRVCRVSEQYERGKKTKKGVSVCDEQEEREEKHANKEGAFWNGTEGRRRVYHGRRS